MLKTLFKPQRTKFNKDLNWNIFSFMISALCGLAINVILVRYYGFDILGFYNIALVLFLVLAQVGTWGIHLAVQRYIPQHSTNQEYCKQTLTSSIALTCLTSLAVGTIAFMGRGVPGDLTGNDLLSEGFVYCVPGIIFMSLNKVLLAFLNGMRFMKSFAVFSGIRTVLMLLLIIGFIGLKTSTEFLPIIFSLSEGVLLLLLLGKLISWFNFNSIGIKDRIKTLFIYGSKLTGGNILLNLNTRMDILVLGIFVSEGLVGVYSFAVFIADGFTQLFYVVRNIINPIITRSFFHHSRQLLKKLILQWRKLFYKIFVGMGILAGILYPVFLHVVEIQASWEEHLIIFYGLLLAVTISSGYLPFQFIFSQTGRAGEQTKFLGLLFVLNLLFNLVFVWWWGIYGAVLAAIVLSCFQVFYIHFDLKKIIESSFLKEK